MLYRSRDTIIKAIQKNDFLKHLEADRIEEIISCMNPLEVAKDTWIINEGEVGSVAYVLEGKKQYMFYVPNKLYLGIEGSIG